jgi:hypothetical protein
MSSLDGHHALPTTIECVYKRDVLVPLPVP